MVDKLMEEERCGDEVWQPLNTGEFGEAHSALQRKDRVKKQGQAVPEAFRTQPLGAVWYPRRMFVVVH